MSYTPSVQPTITDVESLRKYVEDELQRLTEYLNTPVDFVVFKMTNVAPTRPVEGMIAYADGTNWNPGGGKGLYKYQADAWSLV